MRTPSSSTWRARWRASRSRSWRSEPCSGQQPSGPFSPGQPEARALQTHPAHLTTAVTRPTALGSGPRPEAPCLFGPPAGSCHGAAAQAPRERALRLLDPYLLSTFLWSPGPRPARALQVTAGSRGHRPEPSPSIHSSRRA